MWNIIVYENTTHTKLHFSLCIAIGYSFSSIKHSQLKPSFQKDEENLLLTSSTSDYIYIYIYIYIHIYIYIYIYIYIS